MIDFSTVLMILFRNYLGYFDATKSQRLTQGYEGSPARNLRLQHECWRKVLSNWSMFSSKHRVVIYGDGIARETQHFIAGLLGIVTTFLLVRPVFSRTILFSPG